MTRKRAKKDDLPQAFHQLFDSLSQGESGMFIARMTFNQLTGEEKDRFERISTFKKACYDRAVVLGPSVWKNWDFVKDVFMWGLQEPSENVQAALATIGRPSAIGRTVAQRADRYRLLVSHRAMKLSSGDLDKILLHELVHIGYGGHGPDFRAVCKEVGGAVSGSGLTDPGVHLEQKQGARYKRIKTFETERGAKAWYLSWQQEVVQQAHAVGQQPDFGKWRVSFG